MRSIEKLNPLNIAGVRKFDFLPPHISPIEIKYGKNNSQIEIERWIEKNLNKRYWMGTMSKLHDNKIILANYIAFEEATELTIFLLSCPHISSN